MLAKKWKEGRKEGRMKEVETQEFLV